MHAEYGGVVPELASRDHVRKLLPLIQTALADAGTRPEQIDGVAYTAGPGLVGALLVGGAVARSLAFAWERRRSASITSKGICSRRCSKRRRPTFRSWRCSFPAGTPCWPTCAALGRLPDHRLVARRCGRRGVRQDREAARVCRIRAARRWRSSRDSGRPGRFQFPAPDARPAGPRLQLQRAQDRGRRRDARPAAGRADARRRRLRVPASRRRNARREVRARADADRAVDAGRRRRRRRERAAAQRARGARRARAASGPVSAAGVLHGQRGDDRVRWLPPAGRRRARRSEDPRHRALAARHAAAAAATHAS